MKIADLLASAATAVALMTSTAATASVTEYTNAGAFNAATTGATTYDFVGLCPFGSCLVSSAIVGPATFTSTGNLFEIGTAGFHHGVEFLSAQAGPLLVSTAPTSAIAFDYGSYFDPGDLLAITLSDGSTFGTHLPSSTESTSFIGFTSSVPISSISFADLSNPSISVIDLTDFTIATSAVTSAVPEPANWALLLMGLGSVGAAMRLRRGPVIATV